MILNSVFNTPSVKWSSIQLHKDIKGVTQYMSQELGEALVRYWFMSQIQSCYQNYVCTCKRSTRERLLLRGPQTEPSILETENTLFRNRQVVFFFLRDRKYFRNIEGLWVTYVAQSSLKCNILSLQAVQNQPLAGSGLLASLTPGIYEQLLPAYL